MLAQVVLQCVFAHLDLKSMLDVEGKASLTTANTIDLDDMTGQGPMG